MMVGTANNCNSPRETEVDFNGEIDSRMTQDTGATREPHTCRLFISEKRVTTWSRLGRAARSSFGVISRVTLSAVTSLLLIGAFVVPHARAQGTTAV